MHQCSAKTHSGVVHGNMLLLLAPEGHLQCLSLEAEPLTTKALPLTDVSAHRGPQPEACAVEALEVRESKVWRESDLVPGSSHMETASLKMQTCRVMNFEKIQADLPEVVTPKAGAWLTALAVDEQQSRCADTLNLAGHAGFCSNNLQSTMLTPGATLSRFHLLNPNVSHLLYHANIVCAALLSILLCFEREGMPCMECSCSLNSLSYQLSSC
jgi:hypothetical protein